MHANIVWFDYLEATENNFQVALSTGLFPSEWKYRSNP